MEGQTALTKGVVVTKEQQKENTMNVEIEEVIIKELTYMLELHLQHGPAEYFKNVEQMIAFILGSIVDGYRYPRSWERNLLIPMNLVANCQEHNLYRADYGKPEGE
jgi:hypothetical protein